MRKYANSEKIKKLWHPGWYQNGYNTLPELGIKIYRLWPGASLIPHTGHGGRLVSTLPLISTFSHITVAEEQRLLVEGKFNIFDDSFIHTAENMDKNERRIVLSFVFMHPSLIK